MVTIAERIMQLVDLCAGGNMSAFARQAKVTPAYISKLGKHLELVPTDRVIDDICSGWNVNKEWLRTGEGEPFAPAKVSSDIAGFIEAALSRQPEVDRQLLIDKITGMSEAEIVVLAELLCRMFP